MLNKIRDYLDFAGFQYRNPDKAGEEREKMLELRHKGQETRKAFTELAKTFQASHESGTAFATTFLGLFTERRTSDRTYDGLTFIWKSF